MKSDEELKSETESRLQSYKALREQMKLPPLTDEQEAKQRIHTRAKHDDLELTRRQEEARRAEENHQRLLAAWQHRILASSDGVAIVARKGEVFSQTPDGEETQLAPPPFRCELNELNEFLDLNKATKPVVRSEDGYAWTRQPELAFFSDDGLHLTVHWVATAHEIKYGWDYSHAIVQRVIWKRLMDGGKVSWRWTETIERNGLDWASSTEKWTSPG